MNKLTKRLINFTLLPGLFCVPFVAQATVLTFDDLGPSSPPSYSALPEGYNGLTWNNFVVGTVFTDAFFSPFITARKSGQNVIFNSSNTGSVLSKATSFQFNSAYLTALGNNSLDMVVRGYRGGVAVESKSFSLTALDQAVLVNFNWANVDTVVFNSSLNTSSGGINSGGYFGSEPKFAIDNLVIDEPAAVLYTFSGFQPPVNDSPVINIGKPGRTYPVKWQLKDQNGNFVSALSAVKSVSFASVLCGTFTAAPGDAIESETTDETRLRYDTETNQFIYNWKTDSKALCYKLFLTLDDNQVFTAKFNLTK